MPVPRLLNTGYIDDGVSGWRCLQCGQSWAMRSTGFVFCPYCGIRFEGEEINQREERLNRQPLRSSFRSPFLWTIEYRVFWSWGWGDWHTWRTYRGESPASAILKEKRRCQAEEYHPQYLCEVRVRTIPHADNDYQHYSLLGKEVDYGK